MTSEEREAFIRRVVTSYPDTDHGVNMMVAIITDQWENDVDDAFQRGIWVGQESHGAQG